MTAIHHYRAILLLPFALACSTATQQASPSPMDHGAMDHGAMATEVTIPPGVLYTLADVHFMQGMLGHHAQAIQMSHLAETRTTDDRLLRLAQKIAQSQRSEIVLMQGWLGDHQQAVPDSSSYHNMIMPGMLTPAQMDQLRAASGATFNRLYLELMIRHHEGALAMVADLFATPRAAQDIDVNVLANDIHLVQTAEIDVMHQMLANLQGVSP